MRLLWVTLCLLAACSGFTEVVDAGKDGATDGGTHDGKPPPSDGPHTDGPHLDKMIPDTMPGPDTGGKVKAGGCCAKPSDCVSDLCAQLGTGPYYCDKVCNPSADDCPVGFSCSTQIQRCVPPATGDYDCGTQVVQAGPQPVGGCCAKESDCTSGLCVSVGQNDFFCTQTCTLNPDNCPVGYACTNTGNSNRCFPAGSYTCKYY